MLRNPEEADSTERALIGAVMADSSLMGRIRGRLEPSSFSCSELGVAWSAIQKLWDNGDSVDLLSVSGKLTNMGLLNAAGGIGFLSSLLDSGGDGEAVETYCSLVVEQSVKREVRRISREIAAAEQANQSPWDLINRYQTALQSLAATRHDARLLNSMGVLGVTNAHVDKAMTLGGQLPGISSGFDELDQMTGGFQAGELWVVGARPGVGKSSCAVNFANSALSRGRSVAFFSLEMGVAQVGMRFQSADSAVGLQRIRFGTLGQYELDNLEATRSRMARWKLWVDDSAALTIHDIKSKCSIITGAHQLDVVVVDYVQIMGMAGGDTRASQISTAMMGLKNMAKEMGVCVIALAQLKRYGNDDPPTMEDLKESAGLEENADIVLLLHRLQETVQTHCSFIVAKQRNGPTGTVYVGWDGKTASFVPLQKADDELPIEGL